MTAGQAAAGPARRALILTADDFGLHTRVNEAVERAHRNGVLSSASLMVAGDAAADAVERARRLPTLRVGLHVVLADGRPSSPTKFARSSRPLPRPGCRSIMSIPTSISIFIPRCCRSCLK